MVGRGQKLVKRDLIGNIKSRDLINGYIMNCTDPYNLPQDCLYRTHYTSESLFIE